MKIKLLLTLLALFIASGVFAQESKPTVPEIDRIRLAEAFRIGETLGNKIWKDWDKAPFAVLLISPENEFLIRHPQPSKDFALLGYDSLLKSNIYFRKRTQQINFLATFPAVGGVSTIVIGQAENTSKKTSTPWVVTVLHEHFHQLQMAQPGYFAEVERLNLARGDQTGMWMLNFPFPYTSNEVQAQFAHLSRLLMEALQTGSQTEFTTKLVAYLEARRSFQQILDPDDYRYFSFQLWQEGIARYTEYSIAREAARAYRPSREFRALRDYTSFGQVAEDLRAEIFNDLQRARLGANGRVAFYGFGAAEGLLLDQANSRWRNRYFTDKFSTERYFGR